MNWRPFLPLLRALLLWAGAVAINVWVRSMEGESVTAREWAHEKVWEAIQAAVLAGVTPEDLKIWVAISWDTALRDEAKRGKDVLLK